VARVRIEQAAAALAGKSGIIARCTTVFGRAALASGGNDVPTDALTTMRFAAAMSMGNDSLRVEPFASSQ